MTQDTIKQSLRDFLDQFAAGIDGTEMALADRCRLAARHLVHFAEELHAAETADRWENAGLDRLAADVLGSERAA